MFLIKFIHEFFSTINFFHSISLKSSPKNFHLSSTWRWNRIDYEKLDLSFFHQFNANLRGINMDTAAKPKNTSVVKKYPSTRDSFVNGYWRWIEGKRKDDKADGMWRVHDKLYNLCGFAEKHPGGQYWIDITKVSGIIHIWTWCKLPFWRYHCDLENPA